ncbi:MAG: 2OG-Fe(II) oxygenase [Rhodothermaceae bacterium]|nr:2OG-Fe(II) oxygenase [Rhodothermaceae bacterium]MXZ58922.1 2OG-Fe(II) oxygenase [Rhodothermaceae bacterium]MYB91171.1 2OG-Fe(II) oxygenase [Rhodothermaceae bacterium]MYD67981.1 2OG-Fe(II) oxygenase [Rhodothermaceae bacterium]MYG43873.1 2OG-Fe(II) oxygenase [Rhodothermaceae bacterium]
MENQVMEHDQTNKLLTDLLKSIDRPGDYCVGDKLYVPMPQITVDSVGILSFPVSKVQIGALIDVAERAPYGKGTETLLDASVRDCWQIDADQIHVTGGAWPATFKKIMNLVSEGLGIGQGELDAEVYKLLIYEKDGFFAAHRDTEKVPGMIATLTLSLPTLGEGGELVVRHGGHETVYNMSAQEPSELSYAAFYADCLHEVRPVTEGHRISLVFNLFIRSGKKWIGAPEYTTLTEKVRSCLVDWRDHGHTDKLVWLLDHSYSEDGLSFDTLKGTDTAVAQILGEAADGADCDMHAAVLYIHDTGDPEIDYDGDYWGESSTGSTIVELHERVEHLENWVARDGSNPPFGELSLEEIELLPPGATDGAEPDEELLEDYMGNYGPTLDLIYRFAALVVWPKGMTVEIVAKGGIKNAVSWVAMQLNHISDAEMRLLLSKLTDLWPEDRNTYHDRNLPEMLRLLGATEHADIAKDFLNRVVVNHYDGRENETLTHLMPVVGPEWAKEFLPKIVEKWMPEHPKEILFLMTLVDENLGQAESKWRSVGRDMIRSAVTNLRAVLEENTKIREKEQAYQRLHKEIFEHFGSESENEQLLDGSTIRDFFKLALSLNMPQESAQAAVIIADFPKAVTPDRMLPEVLEDLCKIGQVTDTQAYRLLWRQSTDFLLQRSSAPPDEPTDWVIDAEIPCTSDLLVQLQEFCQSPEARVKRFKVNKELRTHIEVTIKKLRLDMDLATERQNRPYTLVCTKNRATYKRRLKEYFEDVRCMNMLLMLVPREGTEDAELDRVQCLEAAKMANQSS